MIKTITITNHLNESVTMDLRFPEKSGFLVRSINGLGPSKANINMSEISNNDGSIYNSARVNSRNIVFSLDFVENPTIEISRQNSYKYFPIKKLVKILIETDTRLCHTFGYVESNEPDIFSIREGCVISIMCPDAYFYSNKGSSTSFSNVTPLFKFPFSNESTSSKLIKFGIIEINSAKSVYYTGDASVGILIYIHAMGPAHDLEIINVQTSEIMKLDSDRLIALTGSDIIEGDDIIISTVKGDKFVYLLRNGFFYNILNALDKDSDWFQLERGNNPFVYTADSGSTYLQFRIENQIAYEGV